MRTPDIKAVWSMVNNAGQEHNVFLDRWSIRLTTIYDNIRQSRTPSIPYDRSRKRYWMWLCALRASRGFASSPPKPETCLVQGLPPLPVELPAASPQLVRILTTQQPQELKLTVIS